MSTTEKLAALERALEAARTKAVSVVATQELGAAKREVRSLLSGNPALRDLFPSRVFGSDDHVGTDALVGALERAKLRIDALSLQANDQGAKANVLLVKVGELEAAKHGKATAKRNAITLLSAHYASAYEKHLSWLRRQVRTEHAPSQALVDALREVEPGERQGARKVEIGGLLGTLDTFNQRTKLKREINGFLIGSSRGHVDLRPRRFLRVEHAPLADLKALLEDLRTEYTALADPDKKTKRTEDMNRLIGRLRRRRGMKDERDACLAKAKQLKSELRQSEQHVVAMLGRVERELSVFEAEAAKLQEGIRAAAEERWTGERAVEAARRTADLQGVCAEWLDDEPTLPDSWDALQTRKGELEQARSAADNGIQHTRGKLDREQTAYETALASELPKKGAPLPSSQALQQAQDALFVVEKRRALAQLELDLLARVISSGDFDEQLARARSAQTQAVSAGGARQPAEIAQAVAALAVLDATLERLQNELLQKEVTVQEGVQLRRFCLDEYQAIGGALKRYHQLKVEYRDTETLVYYISSSQDLADKLFGIAHLLRGRRDTVDSMGQVRVALMIDAGVRLGVELGFLNLTAEVRMTLLLEGTLAVLDTREVMFQSHFGLFVSAEAKASAGFKASAEDGLDLLGAGDLLPVPDLLVEASAKCRANIHDSRGCDVYANEDHWAGRWAHAVARRQAFLKRVKLTREGFETLNEQWLDEQVKQLARQGDSLKFLVKLGDALSHTPREFVIENAERVEARATAQAKAGESERDGAVGDAPGQARYRMKAKVDKQETLLCEVFEDSLDFKPKKVERAQDEPGPADDAPAAPAAFRGKTIYHTLDPSAPCPRGRTEPRAVFEVTMYDAHALSLGPFRFEAAATSSSKLGGATPEMERRHRTLAQQLDAEATDRFDRSVKLPATLAEEHGDDRGAKALARTVRLRLDLLIARGEPAKLTKLLNQVKSLESSVDEKLKTASEKAEKVEKATQQLDEMLRTDGAELASSSPMARGVLRQQVGGMRAASAQTGRLATEAKDRVELLQESLQTRLADLKEAVTLLDNSHAAYARYVRSYRCRSAEPDTRLTWEPVWIAQVHRGVCRRRFQLSAEVSVQVAPLVKVFVGTSLDFESESAEFEVLGLSTFSYLKGLCTQMTDPVWDAWWALHMGEIFDICERVADPGSVPFSEVVLDALEGRGPLREPARALGEACWNVLRTEENPFAKGVFSEVLVVKALQGKLGPRAPAGPTTISQAPVAPVVLPEISEADAALTRTYLSALRDSLGSSRLLKKQGSERRCVESLVEQALDSIRRAELLKGSYVKRYTGATTDRGTRDEVQTRNDLSKGLACLREAEAKRCTSTARQGQRGPDSFDRIGTARELVGVLEARLGLYAELDGRLGAQLRDVDAVALRGQPSDVVALVAEAVAALSSLVGSATAVPQLEAWKRSSSVTLMFRSGATERLDGAVADFHGAKWAAARFDGQAPDSLDDTLTLAFGQVEAIKARLAPTERLHAAVVGWYVGKDDATSKRGPAVAAVLDLPLGAELRRLWLALAQLLLRIEMAERLDALQVLQAGLDAAEQRAALMAQRTFRHQQAVAEAAQRTAAAVKIQRLFRARKQRREGPPLEVMKRCLLAYLRAGAADFAHDPLMHGRKKTLLRGDSFPMHEVPEPTPADDSQ